MFRRWFGPFGIACFLWVMVSPPQTNFGQPKTPVDPQQKEAERVRTAWEAYESTAELVDKLLLGGKVGEITKTVTDPATYKKYTEMAYSMNPVDFFYYATPTYKKELLFDTVMTVTRKVANIAGPVVGFEVVVGLDVIDHMVNLEQGQEPFRLTKDLKVRFLDAYHENITGKTVGQAFDFVFVQKSANDAIKEIHRLEQSFRGTADQLDALARDLRNQEAVKKEAVQKQLEGAQAEIKRLQGLITPEAAPDRKKELDGLVQNQQQNFTNFSRQLQLTETRLLLADRMEKQGQFQRESAGRLVRIGDGVKKNLPLLGKLANYLKENRHGIPVTDVLDMIDVYEEVAALKNDWKGELEDLYDIYSREGFSGLLDKAMDAAFSGGEDAYKELLAWRESIGQLGNNLTRIKNALAPADNLILAGGNAHACFLQVMMWAEHNVENVGKNAGRILTGGGTTEEYKALRDVARAAIKMLEKSQELTKKITSLKKQIDSLQEAALFPSWSDILPISKERQKELTELMGSYEKQKKEILESFEKNTDLGKAKKWLEDKQKLAGEKWKKFQEKWKDVIETTLAVIKLLDKDMPELDLAPDQDFKDILLGWYGGEGTTFTGFALAKDKTSGINPDQVHLFYYEKATGKNVLITDVKVIPEKQTQFQIRETRIQQARIRYRFSPPGPGEYVVWGYVRDRAGHASCALANSRHSLVSDHAKWDYAKEKPEDRRFLEFVQTMMKELGINTDEVFRQRDFQEVNLKLKLDETPAKIIIKEPYNLNQNGFDPARPLRFSFEIEDPESWIHPDDLAVWITDEFGQPIWESKKSADWQIVLPAGLTEAEKFRVEKTKMIPKAVVEVPGARHNGRGIYYACVQAQNGAQIVSGTRAMFFVGEVKPWVIISDVRPFRAFYQQNDEIKIQHTFWNIHDVPIRSVKMVLKETPPVLQVVSADAAASGSIPTGARQRITGEHIFKVSAKLDQQKVSLVYECTLEYEGPQPPRVVAIPVPLSLYDEDALKVNYLKGTLTFKYQDDTRPVPMGAAISVSQVYQLAALGTPKWVEQFVGYGEIGNDAGDFDVRINPVGKPPFRMRLAAKSYAREKNPFNPGFMGTAGVFKLETSQPFTCITRTFNVSTSAENVFKNNIYDVGTQVIPYYSAYQKGNIERIPIQWEGEFSTGGYISPYGHDFAQNPFRAYGNFLTSINPNEITQSLVGQGQVAGVENIQPGINAMETGIWYLNFNGSLTILDTLVKSHRFSKQLRFLAKDGSPYLSAPLPLAFSRGKPESGLPSKIVTTKGGTRLDVTDKIAKALDNNFPFRADLIRERHIRENFFEEHDFVYQSSQPPPGKDYLQLTKRVEESRFTTKKVSVRVYAVADTKNNRVCLVDPTTNTTSTVVEKVEKPVSVQKLSELAYLVCSRAGNEVAIYQNGIPVWTFPPRPGLPGPKGFKPGDPSTLKRPEFAAQTDAGTILICDAGHRRVLEIDPREHRLLWSFDRLVDPVMANLTPRGTCLITDRGAHAVLEVNSDGKVVWTFGTPQKAGPLKLPVSALRAGKITTIADAGNQRVLLIGEDGIVQRTIKALTETRTDPTTGKPEPVSIPLTKLAFAARYSGMDFIINEHTIYGVDPEDRVAGKAGGEKSLALPEHFNLVSVKAVIKIPEKVFHDEPFYVWKKSVQIIKKPRTRVFLDEEKPVLDFDPRYREDFPALGATANYAPGHLLAKKHGLYTAGISLNQDRLRIYVNGGKDNADDNDPHVLARAYGNLLRNKLIRKSIDSHDYDLRIRSTPRQAWEKGWDLFLGCAITEDSKFVDRNFLGKEIKELTFDLDETYAKLLERYKKDPDTLERDFSRYRGLDSPAALALLFHRIYKTQGSVVISHALTFARGGTRADGTYLPQGRYIDPATLLALYPDLRVPMEVLGLIPRLTLKFPDKGVETLNTAYPRLEWDANGLLDDPDSIHFNLVIAEDRPDNIVRQIPGIQGQSLDFGQILRPEDAALKLAQQFEGKKIYYWRVEVEIEDGPMAYRCSSPWGAFEIELKTQVITQEGGSVNLEAANSPLRLYGRLHLPKGAVQAPLNAAFSPVKLVRALGEFEALHGTAFDLRLDHHEWSDDAPVPHLEFQITEKDLAGRDRRGLGVYRFDPARQSWDYLGGEVEDGTIRAPIHRGGLYAVLFDKVGAAFSQVHDSPDPATTSDTLSIRFELRKPTLVSLTVKDPDGKIAATPLEKKLLTGLKNEVQVPLSGWPEGPYSYVLEGTDPALPKETVQVTRTFTVSNAPRGTIDGSVVIPPDAPGTAWTVHVPDTSIRFQGLAGEREFSLTGLAPGTWDVHVERPGLFPEIRRVEVAAGEAVTLPPVLLSNELLGKMKLVNEVFTPNNQGEREYCVLELQARRDGTVKVRVVDSAQKTIATLASSKDAKGGRTTLSAGVSSFLFWRGDDDRGRPMPSGWYTLEVSADALGLWIPAGRVKVLLDRGLVKNAVALPAIFSPNGDGFEDEVQFSYLLDAEARATIEIQDREGRKLATPLKDFLQPAGPQAVSWDGKLPDGTLLGDGRYHFVVLPNYVTGQASRPVRGTFLIDSIAPEIVDLQPLNGQKIADARPRIQARVKMDADDLDKDGLRFKIDEHSVLPDSFDPKTGVYTFQPRTALAEGLHIAIAYARDLAGNEAPPRAVSFTIDRSSPEKKFLDKEPPWVKLLTPADKAVVYTGNPLISAILFDDGSGIDDKNIVVHLDGERICNHVKFYLPGTSGKSWDWYYYEKAIILYDPLLGEMNFVPGAPLAPGNHHLLVEVLDRQGNKGKAELIFKVEIDKEPPVLSDLSPAPGEIQTREATHIQARITDQGPSGIDPKTLRLVIDGEAVAQDLTGYFDHQKGMFRYPLARPLVPGTQHAIVLSVRDRAGNPAEAKINVITLVKDQTPPRIDVFAPLPDQSMAGEKVRLSATLYDLGQAGLDEGSLTVKLDDRVLDIPPPGKQGGPINLALDLPPLEPGPHRLTIFIRDRAGNGAREALVPFQVLEPNPK